MRVVVTGSRHLLAESCGGKALVSRLFEIWVKEMPNARHRLAVATGECSQGGADLIAKQWANKMRVSYHPFPVRSGEWALGKWGGNMRNRRMLRSFKPDLVIAVRNGAGSGTRDCAAAAESMGYKVEWV